MAGTNISGKDVFASLRINNIPRIFRAQSIDVEEVAEEVMDQVNGELRGRPQIITDGFTITIKAYTHDLVLLDAWLEDIANNDARLAPTNKVLGLRFSLLDGTRKAYKASEITRSPFQMSAGGRKERVMQTFKLRSRFFDSVQAA